MEWTDIPSSFVNLVEMDIVEIRDGSDAKPKIRFYIR